VHIKEQSRLSLGSYVRAQSAGDRRGLVEQPGDHQHHRRFRQGFRGWRRRICRTLVAGDHELRDVPAVTFPAHGKLFTEAILKFFRKIIPEQWHNFRNQVTDNFRIISEQNLRVLE
jgi:hypothetical protein